MQKINGPPQKRGEDTELEEFCQYVEQYKLHHLVDHVEDHNIRSNCYQAIIEILYRSNKSLTPKQIFRMLKEKGYQPGSIQKVYRRYLRYLEKLRIVTRYSHYKGLRPRLRKYRYELTEKGKELAEKRSL